MRAGCKEDPGDEVIAAYEAPFPNEESKAGARAFPLILPTEPDAPGAEEGKRVAEALREDDRPTLLLWADSDPALPFSVGERVSSELNYPAPRKIENAGHFLQEDAGAEIGAIIADWLCKPPRCCSGARRSPAVTARSRGSSREAAPDSLKGRVGSAATAPPPRAACAGGRPAGGRGAAALVLEPGDRSRPVGAGRGAGVMERGGEDPAARVVEGAAAGQRPGAVLVAGSAAVGVAGDQVDVAEAEPLAELGRRGDAAGGDRLGGEDRGRTPHAAAGSSPRPSPGFRPRSPR